MIAMQEPRDTTVSWQDFSETSLSTEKNHEHFGERITVVEIINVVPTDRQNKDSSEVL